MAANFSYDAVEYPTAALPQAHPGHIYAIARMFGLEPPPVERCRYLEIGCGDGMHLVAAAVAMPDATFAGIDLSSVAIDRGKRLITELGLHNVSLYATDLTKWDPPSEGFDYAIAHGLYSWVPASVRNALLKLLARCLRPSGVGYVSYNTYPGCYIRRMVWEMLRFHTTDFDDPPQKIGQARELIKFLAAGQPESGPIPAMYKHELDGLLNDHHPLVLYHDDLGEVNDPVYFHEFAAHAKQFGLRFVAEAEPSAMESRACPPAVAGLLDALAERDVLLKEQYLDFLRLRRFRQTLLATDGRAPQKQPDPKRISTLWLSGKPKPPPEPIDLADGVAITFSGEHGAAARTDLSIAKAALLELGARWPGRVPFTELLKLAARRLGREPHPNDQQPLAELLTAVWMAGMIALNGHNPHYAEEVSERPVASPLARVQLRSAEFASTLLQESMRFEDAPSRLLVQLLDGTRTREQLATELVAAFPADNRPDLAALEAGLEKNLNRLARAALLVG